MSYIGAAWVCMKSGNREDVKRIFMTGTLIMTVMSLVPGFAGTQCVGCVFRESIENIRISTQNDPLRERECCMQP